MTGLSIKDLNHIFERLRSGTVPERGLMAFAVGVEKARAELDRQLALAASNEGAVKFLRGGYGCGKTFMAQLTAQDARDREFVTSFVVVSDNDLHFHRFDELYRKVVGELATSSCPRGALGDLLDRWMGWTESALIDGGADPDAPSFDALVNERLEQDLNAMTGGAAPADMVRVIRTIFALKAKGELSDAAALLSWLAGSQNVGAAPKRLAGVKGEIGSEDALSYLRGLLAVVKLARYKGLVIVIDEVETILRMREDTRKKCLNGLRQIVDHAPNLPGLLWLFTGTPELFDGKRGVAALPPLYDRLRLITQAGPSGDGAPAFVSLRQPQLSLTPFDAARLLAVAKKLRGLYPCPDRARLGERVNDAFLARLVAEVTTGFKGDVGVVPRQFLRELVTVFDSVQEHEGYDPALAYRFHLPAALSPEEAQVVTGAPLGQRDEDSGGGEAW